MSPESDAAKYPLAAVEASAADIIRGLRNGPGRWFNSTTRQLKNAALRPSEQDGGLVSVNLSDRCGIGLRVLVEGEKGSVNGKYGVAICERHRFESLIERYSDLLKPLYWDRQGTDRHASIDFRGMDAERVLEVVGLLRPLFMVYERDTPEFDDLVDGSNRKGVAEMRRRRLIRSTPLIVFGAILMIALATLWVLMR